MSLFGGGHYKNPANAADAYLADIPGTYHQYLDPYAHEGTADLKPLHDQFMALMNDPQGFYHKLASGFQASPGYQYQVNQGENAINNAAAAGGMSGSPEHQLHAGQMANNLANQDFNGYMNRVGGYFGQGLRGLSGLENQGYNAGNTLANSIAQVLSQRASNAYAGAENSNAHHAAQARGWGGLIGDGLALGGLL